MTPSTLIVQSLLDEQARLSNTGKTQSLEYYAVVESIQHLRGDSPPPCWSQADCPDHIFSTCPWRVDCEFCEYEE